MPRPNQTDEQRKKLLPIVCQVFSELGYRRTTTADLAERCGVRENILYRLWPDKKAMFLAAIDDIFQRRAEMWGRLLADNTAVDRVAERLVRYEAKHQGEFGFYRVVFTALAETDDADIRSALTGMYRRFQQLVKRHVEESRTGEATVCFASRRRRMGLDRPGDRLQYHPGTGTSRAAAAGTDVRRRGDAASWRRNPNNFFAL